MIGTINNDTSVSLYNPGKEIADFTAKVQQDFDWGYQILNKPFTELNDLSVLEREDRDKRTFNAFVDESIEDPAESWKWRGTRSKARNKAITVHAQITAGYLYPMFMAQNEDDEEDRGFSDVMRDGIEWMGENSDYKNSYTQTALGIMVNPVTYMGADYNEVYQKIKHKTDSGYESKEVIDEILSGFKAPLYTSSQVLIANAYDQNIQRHRFNIVQEWIEFSQAKAIYGDHDNFEHVKMGVDVIFEQKSGQFYEVKDDDHTTLVRKVRYRNRLDDTEVCFLGGVYMGNENVEWNPIKHRTNTGAPKYNITPFGYQRITEHFFFYKSLMNTMYWDNLLYDAQSELVMNRALLETDMPVAISGSDKIDTDIAFPGAVVTFQDPNTRIQPFLPPANFSGAFNALNETSRSMDEGSVSGTTAGQLPEGNQKATSVAIAERNAKTLLQGVGKTLAESMIQYGSLMADIFVNHYSIPIVDELVSDNSRLKYRTFVLKNKNINGREVSKTMKFDESLMYNSMSEQQKTEREIKMAMDTGYPNQKSVLILINPELFARMKYLVRIEPQQMFPKNEEYFQAMMTQLQGLLANNPFVSLEALTRKLLYAFFKGEGEELMQQPNQVMQPGMQPTPTQLPAAGQMAQNKTLGSTLSGVGLA